MTTAQSNRARVIYDALLTMPADQIVEIGVTAGDALEVMTAPAAPAGYVYLDDVPFGVGGDRPLSLHLYRPADPAGLRLPGVVFIHGGGFVEGFPEMLIRYAGHLAAAGYVTASIDYRLATEAVWPAPVEDAKCAVRWMRANADQLGVDPDRIAVVGNSAGGHLAAMVASTPGDLEGTGGWPGVSSAAAAAVLIYPGIDLRPGPHMNDALAQAAAALLGDRADMQLAAAASPITYAEHMPPTLTITGDADPIVDVSRVRDYHRLLDDAGIDNRLVVVPGAAHSFDYSLAGWADCFAEMRSWLDLHVRASGQPD